MTRAYVKYGNTHSVVCCDGSNRCFKCGKEGHIMKEYPKAR